MFLNKIGFYCFRFSSLISYLINKVHLIPRTKKKYLSQHEFKSSNSYSSGIFGMLFKCSVYGISCEVRNVIYFCFNEALAMLYSIYRNDPGSGNLVTFAQFLFIALEGFIFTAKFGTTKLRIPFKAYTILVSMFFVTSVCNNYAFDFNIPMPLHMIFRAVRNVGFLTFF